MNFAAELNGVALESPPPQLCLRIGPVRIDDHAWMRNSFAEGHKNAPGVSSMSWRYYKQYVVPELNACLAAAETLAAYRIDGLVLGWLAISRGRRVDALHWVHTRYRYRDEPETFRQRGVMTALVDAAGLKERLVYTWRASYPRHRSDGQTMDERLLPWLRGKGHHVTHMNWSEWKK